MFSVNLEQTAVPATPGRHNLFFFLGSSAAFSFSQTRLRLIFRRYVNFFLSRKGLARENQSLGPGLSFFTGLARHFLSPRPDHDLFLALCKLLFLMLGSSARKMGSRTRLFFLPGFSAWKMGSRTRLFFLPKSSARKSGSQPQLFFLPGSSVRISATKISLTTRPKLAFHHYANPFPRATHYNVPNEYPCVCAASIRSPSTAAFVADSACSR